jgi:hypothetical protein
VQRFSGSSQGLLWIVDHLPEANIRDIQDFAERGGDLPLIEIRHVHEAAADC